MNIALAEEEAARIVRDLAARLANAQRLARCELFTQRAQEKLERLRKQFQKTINERLLEEPGKPRFAIHEHRGIQQQLNRLVLQTNTQIDDLAGECRRRVAQSENEPDP